MLADYNVFMSKQKIGLFGGTFDPVHNVHIQISLATINHLQLDEMWFLIDKEPLHKTPIASYSDRLNMLKLASKNHTKLIVDKLEIQKTGTRYNIDVLKKFKLEHLDTDFWIILGMDVILNFKKWQNYQDFLPLTNFAIIHRAGSEITEFEKLVKELTDEGLKINYDFVYFEASDVSSSKVRNSKYIEQHQDLSPDVANYIKDKKLYS